MRLIINSILIGNALAFFSLVGFAGLAPNHFAGSAYLLGMFRFCGAFTFIGIIYLVFTLFIHGAYRRAVPGPSSGHTRTREN